MNRELLTSAIGELDDELIAEATSASRRPRLLQLLPLAAAACLVIFCLGSLGRGINSSKLLFGEEFVGKSPVAIDLPQTADLLPRSIEDLSIEFVILAKKSTTISASDGIISVNSQIEENNGEIIAKGEITLLWTIENINPYQSYELRLDNNKQVFVLSHNGQTWTISKK